MFRRADKFYADWWDIDGVRRRKCFKDESEAIAHEHLQAAIKHAIKLDREQRTVELWQAYGVVEQLLRALTDAAGWSPFTLQEIHKSIDDLAERTRPATVSRLANLSLQTRRRALLDIILPAIVRAKGGPRGPIGTDIRSFGTLENGTNRKVAN